MGYYSTVHGRITIEPPLNWAEVRATGLATERHTSLRSSVRIEIETTTSETDEGTVTIRSGVAIVGAYEEGKYYQLPEDLEQAVAAMPGHAFGGALVREGEEQGDVERLRIVDGRVITEKASLRWPDGSPVDL